MEESEALFDFVPSETFAGSKPGYIFTRGKLGVGYYVDVKPVVVPIPRGTPSDSTFPGFSDLLMFVLVVALAAAAYAMFLKK